MAKFVKPLSVAYMSMCAICTPIVIQDSCTRVWNDVYTSVVNDTETSSRTLQVYSTAVTMSCIPAIITWSPIIAIVKYTK
jgi:hypothetical protein